VLGRALATVALVLAFLPAGASADTVWTAAGNGVGCLVNACPSGVLATGASTIAGSRPGSGVGLAVDKSGNVYFVDGDDRVKRVRTDGVIEIVAGNGTSCAEANPCGDGGPATQAHLRWPLGVDVASNGDVFIVDYQARKVRKVRASDGVITTIAGDGSSPTTCQINWPSCSEVGDDASQTGLNQSEGITVADSGLVYFAETDSSLVRKLIPVGSTYRMRRVAPTFVFTAPIAVALDPSQTVLYVTEPLRVLRVDLTASPETVTVVAGSGVACPANDAPTAADPCGDGGPAAQAGMNGAFAVTTDPAGNVYVSTEASSGGGANPAPGRVRRFAPGGTITTFAGSGAPCAPPSDCGEGGSPLAAQFTSPRGLDYDPTTGRLYILEHANPRLRFIAPPPAVTTDAAQSVTLSGGTMAATLRTGGLPVTYRFEYGPTTAYGFQTSTSNAAPTRDPQVVTAALAGLAAGTTTHYRIVATDAAGASSVGADAAFTTLVPGPGVGPSTATLTSAKLSVKWTKGVPRGTLDIAGTTDAAADLTVTLRRVVASGTRPVKGWTIRRTEAGAFSQKLALPKSALSLLPGRYRVDVTGSSPGGKVALVSRNMTLKGPASGIVRDGAISAVRNGAPAARLPGQRSVIWATFRFAALPTKGVIRIDWVDPDGKRYRGPAKPKRTSVESNLQRRNGNLKLGRYQAILLVGGVELRRVRVRLG
jgi:hypothetical protein